MICKNCGKENPAGKRFCVKCGMPLINYEAVPEEDEETTVTELSKKVLKGREEEKVRRAEEEKKRKEEEEKRRKEEEEKRKAEEERRKREEELARLEEERRLREEEESKDAFSVLRKDADAKRKEQYTVSEFLKSSDIFRRGESVKVVGEITFVEDDKVIIEDEFESLVCQVDTEFPGFFTSEGEYVEVEDLLNRIRNLKSGIEIEIMGGFERGHSGEPKIQLQDFLI